MAFKSVIYPSKKKFLVLCGLGLFIWSILFTVAIIILINTDKKFDGYVMLGIMSIVPPFYIFLFYKVIINPKPIMVINSDGLFIHFYGMIYWIEIEKLCLQCFKGINIVLVIIPKDKEIILSRLSSIKRFFVKAKVFFGRSPVELNITLLPMSIEQLLLEMGKFHEAANGWLHEYEKEIKGL